MQVIKIFILSLLCSPLFGQAGASMMMVTATAGDTYLLDDYPADAAYSLRLLKADQIDSAAIRVRRSSDNAEQDIGFTAEGYLDTASMKTFVGANSGYVVTWYDQSGNEADATQAVAVNQPRIVNAGTVDREGGEPSIVFDGINDYMETSSTFSASQPLFFCSIFKASNLVNTRLFSFTEQVSFTARTNGYRVSAGINLTLGTADGLNKLMSIDLDGANTNMYVNGASIGSGDAGSNAISSSKLTLGATSTYTINFDGLIAESIYFLSDQSANRTAIESEINTHYSIY